jgi:hypothetical protein
MSFILKKYTFKKQLKLHINILKNPMPLIEESYLQSLLNECDAYFTREEK